MFSFLTVEVSIGNITSAEDAVNMPPVIDTGGDQEITLPVNSVVLDGSESYDPDGEIVSFEWTYISGPSEINPGDGATPTVSNLIAGTYVFKLYVTDNHGDNDLTTDARVSVKVNPALPPTPEAHDPEGYFDAANCDVIGGWAYDPDTSDEPIIVEIYANGPKGVGTLLFSGPTTGLREDVNAALNITGNHGFTITTPESLKDGADHVIWVYAEDSTTDESISFAGHKTLNCGNPPPTGGENATLSITKIVCPSEADLPNMSGGADITSTTAANFLAQHPTCRLEPNWKFQGAYRGPNSDVDNPAYPGDAFIGEAGSPWTTIPGSTNANGVLTVSFNVNAVWHIWVREVLKDAYIPFASNGVSAEMYCADDVLNYDNIEKIDGPFTAGSTINCVAFNVAEATHTLPQCSDDVDNTDPEDTLADELDPGCHTDGNASNTASYDPNDNDETNGGGNNGDTECSDNVDNADTEDTLADELDPGCHTDGNATDGDATYDRNDNSEKNAQCSDDADNDGDSEIDEKDPGCHTDGDPDDGDDTYDPNDNDETNDDDNGGGGGGGGGSSRPQCSDNKDNSDSEDTLADEKDPGCHTDGNANNPDSYDRRDRSERDEAGEVLGAESACGIYVEEYLRVGYANDVRDVVKVQMFLNMYMNAGLATDGVYGPLTEAAVRNFQLARAENVLSPWTIAESTGIFYLTTQTEVNNIMCPELGLDIPSPLINWSLNTGVDTPAPNPGTTAQYLDISGGSVLGESLGK